MNAIASWAVFHPETWGALGWTAAGAVTVVVVAWLAYALLLTWGLGLTQFQHRPQDWMLAAAGGAAIIATFALMRYYARLQKSPG